MKAQIVSFHCVLKDKLGKTLASSFSHDVINQLEERSQSTDFGLRGLVAGIQNVHSGEKRQFAVPAHEAYGPYNPKLSFKVHRAELVNGKDLELGSEISHPLGRSGGKQTYRVVQVKGDMLILDGNHPLAGQDLVYNIEVVSARDACHDDLVDESSENSKHFLH